MNYIKNKQTGVYYTVPYSYSGSEGVGTIVNVEITTGIFAPILQINNTIDVPNDRIVGYISKCMSKKFTSSPINTPGVPVPDPQPGGGTSSFPVDVIMSHWDGFGRDYQFDNPLPYDILINEPAKGRKVITDNLPNLLPPFFGEYHASQAISVSNYEGSWVTRTENVSVRFNTSQATFDQELQYAKEAGIAAFNFFFYDIDSPNSEARRFYDTSTNKGNIKFLYTMGSYGYRVTDTVDFITTKMLSPSYYKYQGKPVIYIEEGNQFHVDRFINNSTGEIEFYSTTNNSQAVGDTDKKKTIQLLRDNYAAKSNGGELYVVISGAYYYAQATGTVQATGAYSVPPPGNGTDHSYALLRTTNSSKINESLSTLNPNYQTIPTLSLGFTNKYPYPPFRTDYTNGATVAEINGHMQDIKNIILANPTKIPFVNVYSWMELAECGTSAVCPKLLANGTIDKSIVTAFKNWLNA